MPFGFSHDAHCFVTLFNTEGNNLTEILKRLKNEVCKCEAGMWDIVK